MSLFLFLLLAYAYAFVINHFYLQPYRRRVAATAGREYAPGALSFAISLGFPVFALLVFLRTFVIDTYHVPTPSMLPAIEPGQYIWSNRLAYGLRHPWDGRVLVRGAEPQRGEVLVFHYPREPRNVYVKRLIGLPGDRIELNGRLQLNGQLLAESSASSVRTAVSLDASTFFLVVDQASLGPVSLDLTVPEGHYFVLGDNLSHSQDSRHWGFVSDRHLIGRVIGRR